MPTFGERLKELRKEKGLTQEQLAKVFFLNKSSISRYEKDQQIPENDLLKKIADYFDVTLDFLLGISDFRNTDIFKNTIFNGPGTLPEAIKHSLNPTHTLAYTAPTTTELTNKDEKDIEKATEKFLEGLEGGAMLNGEILDDEDFELFKQAVKNGLTYAKISNKKKYTRKDYRKDNKK